MTEPSQVIADIRVARKQAPDMLEADGEWCPMAHANLKSDSFQCVPPLTEVHSCHKIADKRVAPAAGFNLGAFTGGKMAVCTYTAPHYPALVAYDYNDGAIAWTSPPEDLPTNSPRYRGIAALLLAKMAINGGRMQRCIFTGNPAEFVGYDSNGNRLWKRHSREVSPQAPEGVGTPIAIRFNTAKELITATDKGWIVKLNPADGRVIDACKMITTIRLGNKLHRGTFFTHKSPVVLDNTLYMAAEFEPDRPWLLPPALRPIYLVRVELGSPGPDNIRSRIRPLREPKHIKDRAPDRVVIGVYKSGGSPSAWITPDGNVRIIANAYSTTSGRFRPSISVIEDSRDGLILRMLCPLGTHQDDRILAAPAFHAASKILFVTTVNNIFVFRNVDKLMYNGLVTSPLPLPAAGLVGDCLGMRMAAVKMGSPFALTSDEEAGKIIAYTNFSGIPVRGFRRYGFLGALLVNPQRPISARALWMQPLNTTQCGYPAAGRGTFGQPALFRYTGRGGKDATGLIVTTASTGTYVIK